MITTGVALALRLNVQMPAMASRVQTAVIKAGHHRSKGGLWCDLGSNVGVPQAVFAYYTRWFVWVVVAGGGWVGVHTHGESHTGVGGDWGRATAGGFPGKAWTCPHLMVNAWWLCNSSKDCSNVCHNTLM